MRKVLVLLICAGLGRANAQEIQPGFYFETGSTALSQAMLNRLAFGGYISPEVVSKSEPKWKGADLRSGAMYEWSLGMNSRPVDLKDSSRQVEFQGVHVAQFGGFGAQHSGDALKLAFRGNLPYVGETLELGRNRLLAYSGFGLQSEFKYKSHYFGFGVANYSSYRRFETHDMAFSTDSAAERLSMNGQWSSVNAAGNNVALQGYYRWSHFKNDGGRFQYWSASVYNFGLLYLSKAQVESRGAQWDLNKGFRPLAWQGTDEVQWSQSVLAPRDLQVSDWLTNKKDTLIEGLDILEQERSGWVLTPFRAQLMYNTRRITAIVNYRNLPGFLPRLSLSRSLNVGQKSGRSMGISPMISLGGWDTYDLNVQFWFLKYNPEEPTNRLSVNVSLNGLEAWVAPQKQHGAGASLYIGYRI